MPFQTLILLSMPFAVAMALAAGLFVLLLSASRSVAVGIGWAAAMALTDTLVMGAPLLHLGTAVFAGDLASLVLAAVALGRCLWAGSEVRLHRAWLLFLLVMALSLGRGLLTYGTTAGVHVRDYFYFAAVATYVMTFDWRRVGFRALFRPWVTRALALALLVLYRWTVYYLPIPDLLPPQGVYNVDGAIRVIGSGDAILLGQLLIVLVYFSAVAPSLPGWRFLMLPLAGLVLLLQHRSVWLAVMVGAVTPLLMARDSSRAVRQLSALVLVLSLVLLPLIASEKGSGLAAQLGQSAGRALRGQDTASDRLQGWAAMIRKWQDSGPAAVAIGNPFGTDNSRMVIDDEGRVRVITYFAHNMYVQTLYNLGLAGLGAFVAALGAALAGLRRLAREEASAGPAALLFTLLVMMAVYFIPYGVGLWQGLVMGTALAWVQAHAPGAVRGPRPAALRGGSHAR